MAKTVKRPAMSKGSKANKADHKVVKAAKGPKAKPPRGKPARPGFGAGPRLAKAAPERPQFTVGDGAAPARRRAGAEKAARPPKAKAPRGAVRGTGRAAGPERELKKRALRPRAPKDQVAEAPRQEPEERPDPSRPRAMAIAQAALDKKAEDVLVLDVRGLTSYADYFVLLTADSERQATAVADHVDEKMKALGHSRVGSEGYETGRWILIDYGDVVAHVMSREARGFYDLEGLWADAPRFAVAG
jgi:ribosome-associated protein